jgi:hypothetical protein
MSTPTSTVTTVTELEKFKKTGRSGEIALYHTGFLYNDRLNDSMLEAVAATALGYEELGYFLLFQRRLDDMEYEYLAVRTSKGTEQVTAPSLALAA